MKKRQDDLSARLHSTAIRLLRRLRVADRESGTSPARLSALSVLVHGGPLTTSALAEAEQLRLPTVSRLLAGMEKDGLISRRADKSDGRVSWFRATARGRRLLEKARLQRLALLDELLKGIDDAERKQLDGAVNILQRLMNPDA